MRINRAFFLVLFLASLLFLPSARAYWVWSPAEGKFVSPETGRVQKTAEEQFQHALKLREAGKGDEVVQELQRLVRQYPRSAYAPEARYVIAILFEEREKPIRAAAEFQKLIHEFPRSERIGEAMEHLFKLGNLFLSGEKQKIMGMAVIPVLSKAVEVFRFIVEEAPYGPYGDQAQLRLGLAYRKLGNFEEAVKTLEALIANYPSSSLIDEAHFQLAETSYELSQNANRDQRTLNQAAAHLKEFIQQYGTSTLAERARILKRQLDEQDAEKNYRIGLYYEKEGFMESALIYYEDVASRYSQTVFGKKAAERFQALSEPARAMKKGREAIERRAAEVDSMLQALDEEERQKGSQVNAISDTVPLRRELETERASLTLAQKQFQEDTREKFRSRRQALRVREKNLREKLKMFSKRKKLLKQNPSLELEEVFQKWQQSLLQEQEELRRERKTLGTLGLEFKGERAFWFGWVPYFGRPSVPSEEHLVAFRAKDWEKLEHQRGRLRKARQRYEKELARLAAQLAQLSEKEFEIAKATPLFQELLSRDFRKQEETLNQKRAQLDESLRSFADSRKQYEGRYGVDFFKAHPFNPSGKDLQSVNAVVASGANLDETFQNLQKEKASLSETWLAEKGKLDTMVKAFDKTQGRAAEQLEGTVPAFESLTQEEQEKAARLLKKRMKYLEREMRSRLDQIQDWQRENAQRTDELRRLLHPRDRAPQMAKAVSKVLTPAAGTYKLAKAFFFGLPHRDRELIEEAGKRVEQSQGELSSESLKAIRELKEEIELQSILIQGRAEEVSELENRLAELQKQAKQIPGFAYQSMLVERFPSTLGYSLNSARELLQGENRDAIFRDRVNHQTREVKRMESALNELDKKIEAVGIAVERSKRPPSLPGIVPTIPGDTETLPTPAISTPAGGDASPEGKERVQLESDLVRTKAEIDKREGEYQEEAARFKKAIFQWYRIEVRQKLVPTFPPRGKRVVAEKVRLDAKRRGIEKSLAAFVNDEREVAQSQKEFLDRKLSEFEKRLSRLGDPADSRYGVLSEEIKRATARRDSLIHEASFLESSLKK